MTEQLYLSEKRRCILKQKFGEEMETESNLGKLSALILKRSLQHFLNEPLSYIKQIEKYSRPFLSKDTACPLKVDNSCKPWFEEVIKKYHKLRESYLTPIGRPRTQTVPGIDNNDLLNIIVLSKIFSYEFDQICDTYSDQEKISLGMIESATESSNFQDAYSKFMAFDTDRFYFRPSSRKQRVKGSVHQMLLKEPHFKHKKEHKDLFKETFTDKYNEVNNSFPSASDADIISKLYDYYVNIFL